MLRTAFKGLGEKNKDVNEYLQSEISEIDKNNLLVLKMASVVTALFTLIFIITTPLMIKGWTATRYHVGLFLWMVICSVASHVAGNKKYYNEKILGFLVGGYVAVLMAVTIVLDGVLYPEVQEGFVGILLVVLPVLFITSFRVMFTFQLVYLCSFVAVSGMFKVPEIWGRDCFMAFLSCMIGIALYVAVTRIRVHDFRQKKLYKVLSEVDSLTGIDNRASSRKKIEQYINMQASDYSCAMIVLDVDYFKEVNDNFGHNKGDKVLKEIAQILKDEFRVSDVIGRFGGDEFLVFLKDIESEHVIKRKCDSVNKKAKNIIKSEITVSCSIGICALKNSSATIDDMFKVADMALYEAKAEGRNAYVYKEYA